MYEYFIESDDPTLNGYYRELFSAVGDSFSIEDVRTLAMGKPLEFDDVLDRHGLRQDPYPTRGKTLIQDCGKRNQLPLHELNSEPLQRGNGDAGTRTFRFRGHCGIWRLEARNPHAQKPVLLCIPPWSQVDWASSVSNIEAKLVDRYSVMHLYMSTSRAETTFSSWLNDIREAVREIQKGIDGLDSNREHIALLAVGAACYVAAEAGRQLAESPDVDLCALCLLAPEIDLLDTIDSFYEPVLFTRKFGLAQVGESSRSDRFFDCHAATILARLGGPRDILGNRMKFYYLLDLLCRGFQHCGRDYFRRNIEGIIKKQIPVFLGSSPSSRSTRHEDVEMLAKDLGERVVHREIPWFLDVESDGGQLVLNPSCQEGTGLWHAIEFLLKHAQANDVEVESARRAHARPRGIPMRGLPYGPYKSEICLGDEEKKACNDLAQSWERYCTEVYREESQHAGGRRRLLPSESQDLARLQYFRVCDPDTDEPIGIFRLTPDTVAPRSPGLDAAHAQIGQPGVVAVVDSFLKEGAREPERVFEALFARTLLYCMSNGIEGIYIAAEGRICKHYVKFGFVKVGSSFRWYEKGAEWCPMLLKPLEVLARYDGTDFRREMRKKNGGIGLDVDFWRRIDESIQPYLS